MRCVRVLISLLLVAPACSPATTDSTSPSPPVDMPMVGTVGSTTPADVTSTTRLERPRPGGIAGLVEGAAGDAPSVLVSGWDGVSRVEGDNVTNLVEEPVWWATEDGAGGIVYRTVADEPGWAWLAAGGGRPVGLGLEKADVGPFFVVEGRPSALVSRRWNDMAVCAPDDFTTEETVFDLRSGEERFLRCADEGSDGGEIVSSFGGGLFSSVGRLAVGAGGTDTALRFYDLLGEEVDVEHNPFAESCAPCHLTSLLSPDGSHLAYTLWPTALWPPPQPADGDYLRAHREWLLEVHGIPTELVVLDVSSGVEVFRTELEADARLMGFDGRVLSMEVEDGRLLIDIEESTFFEVPPVTTGQRDFWTVILASLDHTTTSYNEAQDTAGAFAGDLDVPTGVMWSDGFITLNAGYWAVFTGHFDTRAEADALCLSLDVSCYPRYVATADTIDLELARDRIVLEPDGLGVASFGAPEAEVMTLFERILGSPPTGSYDEAGWVEYLGWEDHGLYLGFSREWHDDWDEDPRPRFIGWQLHLGSADNGLATSTGVGIGTTLAELRSIYGEDLVVHEGSVCDTEYDESWVAIGGPPPITVRLHPDIGVVSALFAGVQTGC